MEPTIMELKDETRELKRQAKITESTLEEQRFDIELLDMQVKCLIDKNKWHLQDPPVWPQRTPINWCDPNPTIMY